MGVVAEHIRRPKKANSASETEPILQSGLHNLNGVDPVHSSKGVDYRQSSQTTMAPQVLLQGLMTDSLATPSKDSQQKPFCSRTHHRWLSNSLLENSRRGAAGIEHLFVSSFRFDCCVLSFVG